MADNSENEEDLEELEVRLYSQVHHDSVNIETCSNVAKETENVGELGTGVNNNESSSSVSSKKRYWATDEEPAVSQHRKFIRSDSGAPNAVVESIIIENVTENSEGAGPGATPSASGGGPEKKRSINPFSMKGASKNSASKKHAEVDKLDHAAIPDEESPRFLNRKMRKLEQKKKLNKKREKARLSQQKKGKKAAETIVLESSDEEDVVVVPVPPPPVVSLDSSDEEGDAFAKPNPRPANEKMPGTSNSRCNSPNSVMSDDFIVQQDKKRLLSETNVAEDDELQCSENENRKSNHDEKLVKSLASEDFASPAKRVNKPMKQNQPTYEVTQSNFRAVDVYESESSDMPESVYGKGKRKKLGTASDAGGSDVEEIVAVKTKRLRKRKASGSCKSSEPNDGSSDSEALDNSATALPYISRGEAVEHCKLKTKRRQVSSHEPINQADQEFMDKLSNIVRGNDERSPDLDEDHDSSHSVEEEITARDIAEVVLKQTSKTAEEAVEEEAAIPSKAIVDQELLNVIDKICTKIDDYEEPPRHGRDPTPELFFEETAQKESAVVIIDDSVGKTAEKNEQLKPASGKKHNNQLDFMHVVYTNREHVAWNDEMVRFYELSWGQEKFNVDRILRLMDRNTNWRIKNSDRFPKSKRYSNLKCHNCCEVGHRIVECPLPRKDLICFICGDIGHKEPRCPNTICLRCGGKTNVYTRSCQNCIKENQTICPICRIRGHSIDLCPDKWRRYHSTTAVNEHPNTEVHYNEKKFCCVCAGRGHLPEQCRSSNKLNEYHAPTTEIRYHSKTYEDVVLKDEMGSTVIGVHLMCRPDENVTFPFLKKVTKNQYYGRFLEAVDLFDAPESKIVKNMVLNPFAKCPGSSEKVLGNQVKGKKSSIRADKDDIQLNVSGILEINDDDDVEMVSEGPGETPDKKCLGKAKGGKKEVSDAIVTLDTDSNYSFSEHFPSTEKHEGESDAAFTINRRKSVGALPDFIPIFDDTLPKVTREKQKNIGALPEFISLNDSEDEEETKELGEEKDSEEDCEGKIYLSKFHSKFLLSPSGTTYLIEASNRHNVKVSMDWTAVGNVLVIEGPTANQDKFHADLMEKMKLESDQVNRNIWEQSQKLPRPREALIKLLQDSILGLEKDLGNVQELHKKMKYNQSNTGKNSFKAAEKSRKLLNMILMGQGGLREGSMHLSILQDKLRELQFNMTCDHVSDEFRVDLEKHYRYIFSSMQHNNYDQLIRQYTAMKRLDQLPKLELDYKLLGKKVLDTQFTKEQKEQLNKATIGTPPESKPQKNEPGAESAQVPRTEFGVDFCKQREHKKYSESDLADDDEDVPPPPRFNPHQKNSPGMPNFQRGFNPPQGQSPAGQRGFNTPNQNQQGRRGRGGFQRGGRGGFQRGGRGGFNSPNQRPFQRQMGGGNSNGNFAGLASNKLHEISKKWDDRANNSLNELPPPIEDVKQEKRASSFWSRECIKFIARCMSINGLQPSILDKLARLSERAANNQLSFNDFKSIKRIYYNLLKTDRGPGFSGNQSC